MNLISKRSAVLYDCCGNQFRPASMVRKTCVPPTVQAKLPITLTALKRTGVTLLTVSDCHVAPKLSLRRIVPPAPTKNPRPLCATVPPSSRCFVAVRCAVQLAPPSVVANRTPVPPNTQPCCPSENTSRAKRVFTSGVLRKTCRQVMPPSVVFSRYESRSFDFVLSGSRWASSQPVLSSKKQTSRRSSLVTTVFFHVAPPSDVCRSVPLLPATQP